MEGRIGKESDMEGGRHIEREREETKRDLRVYSRDLLHNQDQDSPNTPLESLALTTKR